MAYLQVEETEPERQSGWFKSLFEKTRPAPTDKTLFLKFAIMLKAVHMVANSPDPRSVSEADELMLRQKFVLGDPKLFYPASMPGVPTP